MSNCPLCNSQDSELYCRKRDREYLACGQCGLVYVPSIYWLSREAEKAHYDTHENIPTDAGYRKFLSKLSEPLLKLLPSGCSGLDFGSGAGSALPALLEEQGHSVELYDLFYYPDTAVFEREFQFIVATEVLEHLKDPLFEVQRLWNCLKPGGYLAFMTSRLESLNTADIKGAFMEWHYIVDPTHICFWSEASFTHLANGLGASEIRFEFSDLVFIKKAL